ncbi:hypothetical protein C8J57DRAFT_1739971 [Mycena rebaudengoi]|nr:hypothetical protein C8J57DRAFT_1739971 [Mycena rebaudengoi]
MSEPHAQPELKRVEDLWFSDAALILRAEGALFRVHSGILGARCSVFRNMLILPQPPSGPYGDTVDGLVVVRLHDSAAEVEVFLRAIFDSGFFKPPPFAVDFTTVIGVMRLAHNVRLFRRALSHLDSLYLTDFSTFIALKTEKTEHHITEYYFRESDRATLQAASEVGALWILPTVYYMITRGCEDFHDAVALDTLDSRHKQICLAAGTDFSHATASTHRFLEDLPDSCCFQVSQCKELIAMAHYRLTWLSYEQYDHDPLSNWALGDMDETACSACIPFGRKEFEEEQNRFWNDLPHIFKLPEWTELIEMRQKAMDGPM